MALRPNRGPAQNAPPHDLSSPRSSHVDYTVACICPMGVELAPVEAMLDKIDETLPTSREQNAYTLGQLGAHKVVIAVMPQIGNNTAATVATQLLNDFPSIRFGFLIGIGGGVPGKEGDDDVRLGDIVVSQPSDTFGGVVQYDMGKALGKMHFERIGQLNKPPEVLSANVRKLDGQHRRKGHNVLANLMDMWNKNPRMKEEYCYPGSEHDQLFKSEYIHQSGATCNGCDREQTVARSERSDLEPRIHYGAIGSANTVVQDAFTRDSLKKDIGILCVEMEAAGLMDTFPCLVVRGICDYADSHKNKRWQPYAAAVAALYVKELLELIPPQQVKQTVNARSVAPPHFSFGLYLKGAPDLEPQLFIGREAELEEMATILRPEDTSVEQRKLVLGGLGGMGKTQLAIAYAKKHRHSYEYIFWLNATSSQTLTAGLQTLAQYISPSDDPQHCDLEQLVLLVSKWLSDSNNTRWLLILDNYDEPDQYDITAYYPYASHGSIIVTTRAPDRVRGTVLKVSQLNAVAESLQILQTRSERENVDSDTAAVGLADRLCGFPLALATAGAYLKKSIMSFERYLEEYDKRWNISPSRPTQLPEYSRTLYTTWNVSFEQLQQEDLKASQLLTLFGYFDNQDIWYDLLHAGQNGHIDGWLLSICENDLEFESVMVLLVEYCFVEAHAECQSYSLHTCVHDWILHHLNSEVDADRYWFAFDCVARSIADEDLSSLSGIRFQRLAGHGLQLTHSRFDQLDYPGALSDLSGTEVRARFRGIDIIAMMLAEQDYYAAAETMHQRALICQEEALRFQEKGLAPNHAYTLHTMNALGRLYIKQDKLQDAEKMFQKVLQSEEKILEKDYYWILQAVTGMGDVKLREEDLEEAEKWFQRALQDTEKRYGSDESITLLAVQNLGALYWKQGKLNEAEEMYKRSSQYFQKRPELKDQSALNTINILGLIYRDQGKWKEAEEMYQWALKCGEEVFGPEHTSTLQVVNNLGLVYQVQERLIDAEQMVRRALQGYEKVFGPRHASTLEAIARLGYYHMRQARLQEAEAIFREFLKRYDETVLSDRQWIPSVFKNIGMLYTLQGRFHEAEESLQRSLQGYERVLGSEECSTDTNALNTIGNLAMVQAVLGKREEAKDGFQRALHGFETVPAHIAALKQLCETKTDDELSQFISQAILDGVSAEDMMFH